MPILELPLAIAGRKVRPVALGLMLWGAALLWAMIADGDLSLPEHVTAGVILVGAVAFTVGWLRDSTRMEQAGLLCAVFVAVAGLVTSLLTVGWAPRDLVSLGALVISVGAYWLEELDPTGQRRAKGAT